MNILVPMAGRGSRFVEAGYDRPKPFIMVDKYSPMIEMVMLNLIPKNFKDEIHFIFLCLSDFLTDYGEEFKEKISLICSSVSYIRITYEVIEVKSITEGAACTALLAKEKINTDEELVIANCDQLVLDPDYMTGSISYYRLKKADGGILCFLNDCPKWSYCRMVGEKITEVAEKQVISNIATVGIYYYRKGKIFVENAEKMILNQDKIKGEYYIAPVYNYAIVNGHRIVPYMVNDMVGLGIPADLENYQKRIKHENV